MNVILAPRMRFAVLLLFLTFCAVAGAATAQAPKVRKVIINGGLPQRSMVTMFAIQFTADVGASLQASDLHLVNQTTNTAITDLKLKYNRATKTGIWTFPSLPGKSLPDGNYIAFIRPSDVLGPNSVQLEHSAGSTIWAFRFFRFFGDFDGDRDVDALDTARFRRAQSSTSSRTALSRAADSNADNKIDAVDLAAFQSHYRSILAEIPSTPVLVTPPRLTSQQTITVAGKAAPKGRVVITNGFFTFEGQADDNGNFSIAVGLLANRINSLFVVGDNFINSDLSTLTPFTITQDSTPPFLYVDSPANDSTVDSVAVSVTGRVGDLLSGFDGLTVKVNQIDATVTAGIGPNGTFSASNVPLNVGENFLAVVATDGLGNQITKSVMLTRVQKLQFEVVSGNDQITTRNTELPLPLVVLVRDSDGTPFANKIVNFQIVRSDGHLAPSKRKTTISGPMLTQVRTDAQGIARAFWMVGSDSGKSNNLLEATSAGVPGEALFRASSTPRPPSQINVGMGNNQIGEAGGLATQPLTAWVSDNLNGAPNVPVLFTVTSGDAKVAGASDAIAGRNVTLPTDGTGHVSAILRFGPSGGPVNVEASFLGSKTNAIFTSRALVRTPGLAASFTAVVQDNTGLAIGGATCTLNINGIKFPSILSDPNGLIAFKDVSAGAGFIQVDGRTANSLGGKQFDQVGRFPSLVYRVTVIADAENPLPTTVYLPTLNPANERIYDGTSDVELTIQGIAGLKMKIKSGSMTLADGTKPTTINPVSVSLNQVHSDNIPMPIQDGVAPLLTWTLQPPGAHFDPPIEIQYPNMGGLRPGAVTNFLSYNHDVERFEIVASGTVSADGSTIQTDPGVGLLNSGWGCNCPPYSATGSVSGKISDPNDKPFTLELKTQDTDTEQVLFADAQGGSGNFKYSWKVRGVEISTSATIQTTKADKAYNIEEMQATVDVEDTGTGNKMSKPGKIMIELDLATDWNRDGRIDAYDFLKNKKSSPKSFHFWVNDDDAKTVNNNGSLIDQTSDDIPNSPNPDYSNNTVDGIRDLLDFFPVAIHSGQADFFKSGDFKFIIRQADSAVNIVFSDIDIGDVGDIHKRVIDKGFGPRLSEPAYLATVQQATSNGVVLADEPLKRFDDNHDLIIFCEGRTSSTAPLVFEIQDSHGNSILKRELPLSLGSIRDMMRIINMRNGIIDDKFASSTPGPWPTNTQSPPNLADGYYSDTSQFKTLIHIHGFIWSGDEAPAAHAQVFKRLFQAGSNARFIGVTWFSDQAHGGIPDYYENVINAFVTAFHLRTPLQPFLGTNTVFFSHSLGNIVTSSLLNDYPTVAGSYLMIDAAVPAEAYNPEELTGEQSNSMTPPDWKSVVPENLPYPELLTAPSWHLLFNDNDRRHQVTWSGRFSKLRGKSMKLINYYSSGEDVLENGTGTVPALTDAVFDQRQTWVFSEMNKGGVNPLAAFVVTDRQGGWRFCSHVESEGYYSQAPRAVGQLPADDPDPNHQYYRLLPSDTVAFSALQLIPQPFFSRFSGVDLGEYPQWSDGQWLYASSATEANTKLPDISAGVSATDLGTLKNHARLLAGAIPTLSFAAGANRIVGIDSIDLQLMKGDGWPRESGRWTHGDYLKPAYLYVSAFYRDCVTQGGL